MSVSLGSQAIGPIASGTYDLVYTTADGYESIFEGRYCSTSQPVVTDVYLATDLTYSASSYGDYVALCVYGLNLDKASVPVFYSRGSSSALTEASATGFYSETFNGYSSFAY